MPARKELVTIACAHCGAEFRVLPSRGRRRFCGAACRIASLVAVAASAEQRLARRATKDCAHCGAAFVVRPKQAKQFCGRACHFAALKVEKRPTKNCATCGAEFRVNPCNIKRAKFCGVECRRAGVAAMLWTGGRAASKARRRAREVAPVDADSIVRRDGCSCYICGRALSRREVTLDHVTPLARGGAHAAENLRVACKPCNSRKRDKPLAEFVCFLETAQAA